MTSVEWRRLRRWCDAPATVYASPTLIGAWLIAGGVGRLGERPDQAGAGLYGSSALPHAPLTHARARTVIPNAPERSVDRMGRKEYHGRNRRDKQLS